MEVAGSVEDGGDAKLGEDFLGCDGHFVLVAVSVIEVKGDK